jgi:hypothetical protein
MAFSAMTMDPANREKIEAAITNQQQVSKIP